jgi:DNA-binding NtrC family response regulator
VLDEIGELPLELQPKLLRALESRTITRLGETKSRSVDVRFVASTHRNLEEEVAAGRFREDLYFRLSVITVRMPPLRERKEEIPRLVRHFLTAMAGDRAPEVPAQTMELLLAHDWPGNCRELRNFVERFLALPELPPDALLGRAPGSMAPPGAPDVDASLPFHEAKERFTDRFERAYFERLLGAHGKNLSEAARVAGLSRQTCYRLIRKHGLKSDD